MWNDTNDIFTDLPLASWDVAVQNHHAGRWLVTKINIVKRTAAITSNQALESNISKLLWK